MKQFQSVSLSFLCICFLMFALVPVVAENSAAGSDAAVPDIETRIKNSGNTIPDQALPLLAAPLPAAIPAEPVIAPVPEPAPAEPVLQKPQPVDSPAVPFEPDSSRAASPISGTASVGAGTPGLFSGAFSFARSGDDFPSLGFDFSCDSADGYSGESSGDGYFDRTMRTKAHVASSDNSAASAPVNWFADAFFSDRAYGFQEMNPRYNDLARRDVSWSLGADSIPLFSSPFMLSVKGDGSVYSSFAEGQSAALAHDSSTAPFVIADTTGYYLSPLVALSFSRGNFSGELSGRFGYETAADLDEVRNGEGSLALHYGISGFEVSLSSGVAGDSQDGAVVPFGVGLSWNGNGDAKPAVLAGGIAVQEFHLSGGIDRTRVSLYALSEIEPFADTHGLSVYADDWNVLGGFTLGYVSSSGSASPLSVALHSEYRRSLSGHGTLAATDSLDSSALVAVERFDRSSLVTGADVKWLAERFAASAGYSGEWLDRLDRRVLQTGRCGIEVFDRDKNRKWDSGIDASFALDRADVPVLSAKGTLYPVRNFSIALSCDDAVCFITGKERTRNGLYMERSGTLKLSAGINF